MNKISGITLSRESEQSLSLVLGENTKLIKSSYPAIIFFKYDDEIEKCLIPRIYRGYKLTTGLEKIHVLRCGLSWLAWFSGTSVMMITCFSKRITEFETPYRILSSHSDNSCWNDQKEQFDRHDFLWCLWHAHTLPQRKYTRLITAQ